ncbi:hypothetical protein CAAN1_04S07932 [[Candida] anglica]|uniref:Mitochondrial group I intron splicing factor CCM1 n=1 Tax=[Candida] anglica TaxID=148631 RepID=A0ABP0E8I4_9ASCO
MKGALHVLRNSRPVPVVRNTRSLTVRSERYRSTWFNPLSKFQKKFEPTSTTTDVIIEEPTSIQTGNEKDSPILRQRLLINDLKHYLKTDIPGTLQQKILSEKLLQICKSEIDFTDMQTIPMINKVFLKLYKLNGKKVHGVLELDDILNLFEKSTLTVGSGNRTNGRYVPEYLAIISKHLLLQQEVVPSKYYVYVVALGSSVANTGLCHSLQLLFNNKELKLSPEFTTNLIKYQQYYNKLDLQTFEDIISTVKKYKRYEIIDEGLVNDLVKYVESLYDTVPIVHEYKNLDKNINRVRSVLEEMIDLSIKANINIEGKLNLAKICHEIESVSSIQMEQNERIDSQTILKWINDQTDDQNLIFEQVRRTIFKQDLGNESLAEMLLISTNKLLPLGNILIEYIQADDVKFSPELRFQASLLGLESKGSESEIYDQVEFKVKEILDNSEVEIDPSLLYTKTIQAIVLTGKVAPRGYFTQKLMELFRSYSVDQPLYSFKYRLDRAILDGNYISAVNIFDDSLESFTQWLSDSDPMIRRSLNSLIVLLCYKMDNIEDIFPIFTKIKQQMVNCQCDISAINAMSYKMLQTQFVGDTIEFLKRELPDIKKDDTIKLPIDGVVGQQYLELFKTLHTFVLTYTGEETYETNWVLYGEIHKYFHVPSEYYLPAMKFFCQHDRLNAALIIFRQMIRLSELHGKHNHLPPSRDIYVYLLQEFGNKLYEEGVEEVHERLKMDLNLPKQDILLQNTILNAYSNLQDISRAKDVFLAMSTTPKQVGGINEDTIQIMIKTYTYSDIVYVRKFWNNLSQYGIIPNYGIYKQYLIAHVYHGLPEDAILLTEEMKDYDLEVSSDLLLGMYNYSLEEKDQQKISEWAEKKYPEQWTEVKNSGYLKAAGKYQPETSLLVEGK